AYVRTERDRIMQIGLVGGQKVLFDGKPLLEVGPQIASASVQYTGAKVIADVRGHGKILAARGSSKTLVLNGRVLSPDKIGTSVKGLWQVEVPNPGPLEIRSPALSTDATAVYKALVGFRPGPALPPWNPVVVSYSTRVPADATIEYAAVGSK